MKLYDVMLNHRSIRKYLSKDVPDALLNKILEAGIRASSSGNMQAYSIIVTRDQELKQKLYRPHFGQEMVLEAPILLTFCADFHRMRKWLAQREAPPNFDNFMSFMIASIDAILVSQNVALAAESEGLGICYMGTTLASCDQIGEILELPENVIPVVGFSLGYPDERPERRDRLKLQSLVHYEKYRDYPEQDIDRVYAQKEKAGWKRYCQIPELNQKIQQNKIKNLAQIYTKIKYTRQSHIQYSNRIIRYLQKQNFLNSNWPE